jgi:hypothetical protein
VLRLNIESAPEAVRGLPRPAPGEVKLAEIGQGVGVQGAQEQGASQGFEGVVVTAGAGQRPRQPPVQFRVAAAAVQQLLVYAHGLPEALARGERRGQVVQRIVEVRRQLNRRAKGLLGTFPVTAARGDDAAQVMQGRLVRVGPAEVADIRCRRVPVAAPHEIVNAPEIGLGQRGCRIPLQRTQELARFLVARVAAKNRRQE